MKNFIEIKSGFLYSINNSVIFNLLSKENKDAFFVGKYVSSLEQRHVDSDLRIFTHDNVYYIHKYYFVLDSSYVEKFRTGRYGSDGHSTKSTIINYIIYSKKMLPGFKEIKFGVKIEILRNLKKTLGSLHREFENLEHSDY